MFLVRNEAALSETERRYGAYIGTVSFGILRDRADAEEIKNDTLLALWQSIPPHVPENFKAFLTTVVRRKSLNLYKHKQHRAESCLVNLSDEELEGCLPSPETVDQRLDAEALSKLLDAFLRQQTRAAQRVFVLRYYFYKNVKEISDATGFSESKVKSLLFRTREKLRAYLAEEDLYL